MYKIHNPGWHKHCETENPLHDLGRFIQTCAQDPHTRVMGATALVLALCQTAGPALLSQPPGFLLLNAGGEAADPIDEVMKKLIGHRKPAPRPDAETFERCCRQMRLMLQSLAKERSQLRPGSVPALGLDLAAARCDGFGGTYHEALDKAFGTGRAAWYADRHDESFGWVADETNHVILRVEREQDRLRLKEDIRLKPELLIDPQGCGGTMRMERKVLSIAGSLPAPEWDPHVAYGVVELGLPVLFLPHTASEPLVIPGDQALDWIGIGLASEACLAQVRPVEARKRFATLKVEWLQERIGRLRERLRHFPADYEFFVMRTVRELLPCCQRLVTLLATGRTSKDDMANLVWDLYAMVVQGVCLGVDALGWHGYGFDSTCNAKRTRQVLNAIRDRGSLSKRDLLRNQQWLDAESRDAILAAFDAEGLVMITDNEVTAMPFTDYLTRVRQRMGGNLPAPLWKPAAPR